MADYLVLVVRQGTLVQVFLRQALIVVLVIAAHFVRVAEIELICFLALLFILLLDVGQHAS